MAMNQKMTPQDFLVRAETLEKAKVIVIEYAADGLPGSDSLGLVGNCRAEANTQQ